MFDLPEEFGKNRFESAVALGTQAGLSRSKQGLGRFLKDLAYVTTESATAILDGYDPEHEDTKEILDYYQDPSDGLAYCLLQMEYNGILSEIWLYRSFTPDRVRDVATNCGLDSYRCEISHGESLSTCSGEGLTYCIGWLMTMDPKVSDRRR